MAVASTIQNHLSNRPTSGLCWTRIRTASELMKWEIAWNGPAAQDSSTQQPRLFLPNTAHQSRHCLHARIRINPLIAGAIANRTDDVVGLSMFLFQREIR